MERRRLFGVYVSECECGCGCYDLLPRDSRVFELLGHGEPAYAEPLAFRENGYSGRTCTPAELGVGALFNCYEYTG